MTRFFVLSEDDYNKMNKNWEETLKEATQNAKILSDGNKGKKFVILKSVKFVEDGIVWEA